MSARISDDPVEVLWRRARALRGNRHSRKSPKAETRRVVEALALAPGPLRQAEASVKAGVSQGNTSRILRALGDWGFAELVGTLPPWEYRPPTRGGGRDAKLWKLTTAGHELYAAMVAGNGAQPCSR